MRSRVVIRFEREGRTRKVALCHLNPPISSTAQSARSTGAKVAIPLLGAYSSSKSGLEGMSDALRRELMLFGIEVVIIEPGTVNTAMYDKGEKEDLSEFKQTEYWEAVQNFQKFIVAEARNNGLSPERLGEAVHVALSLAKPKARYAVVPQRFKNWTLPRLLPVRMLDARLAKVYERRVQEIRAGNRLCHDRRARADRRGIPDRAVGESRRWLGGFHPHLGTRFVG
jgi:short subunit dehydrogenase